MNKLMKQTDDRESILRRLVGYRGTTVVLVILVLSVMLTLASPHFLTASNLSSTSIGFAADGVIVIGMCLVILTGGIDLSVGSVMAASMVIAGKLFLELDMNIWVASLIALVYAVMCGLINGFFIGKVGLNAMITTLGMMNMSRGVTMVVSGGSPVSLPNPDPAFTFLGAGDIAGIPTFIIIMIVFAIIVAFMLNNLGFMRKIYYTGSNEKAAMLSGINTANVKLGVYTVAALFAGLAGILSLARFKVAAPNSGTMSEMRAISACIIGGTSLSGGEGSIFGAVLGVIMLNIINNGLVLLKVDTNWQNFVAGAVLLIAVTIDFYTQQRKQKARIQQKSKEQDISVA